MIEWTEITSRTSETVKEAVRIYGEKKERDRTGLFPVEGIKLVEEALLSGLEFDKVFFTRRIYERSSELLNKLGHSLLFLVSDEVYQKLTDESAPQGILGFAHKPKKAALSDSVISEGGFVLLEDIQNPLNIGAILRCCYSLGFEKVVFSSKCADIYSPKCARAAMGSLFKIKPYFSDDLALFARELYDRNKRVFCTSLSERSISLGSFDFESTDSFAIGNEGHGVSDALLQACSHSLFIPMNQGAESLNAATAAAIVMWEMKKGILCKK